MTWDQALAAARVAFDAGSRVEMGPLAESLGVNRTTLFRWVGSRDALLGELVWERLLHGLERGDRYATRSDRVGADRLTVLLSGLFAGADAKSPVRALVAAEPAAAMRVMTTGVVHDRLIAWFARVITEETERGAMAPRYAAAQIAELIVKTGEAVFWFDVASGRGLDSANMAVLLDALCSPAATRSSGPGRSRR